MVWLGAKFSKGKKGVGELVLHNKHVSFIDEPQDDSCENSPFSIPLIGSTMINVPSRSSAQSVHCSCKDYASHLLLPANYGGGEAWLRQVCFWETQDSSLSWLLLEDSDFLAKPFLDYTSIQMCSSPFLGSDLHCSLTALPSFLPPFSLSLQWACPLIKSLHSILSWYFSGTLDKHIQAANYRSTTQNMLNGRMN